jgi:hypothetical protein
MKLKISSDTLTVNTLLPDMSQLDSFQMIKKNGRYNTEYMNLVKSQDLMDAHMAFAPRLEIRFNQIPMVTEAATMELKFESNVITEDVEFDVQLAAESAEHYRIEPFKGILKKGQLFSGILKVYAKHPVKVEGRYFVPKLSFNAHYKTRNFSGLAIGRECRYYPPEE